MDMMSSSTTSGSAAAASSAPPHNHEQKALVSSPIIKAEARSPKQAHATQHASGGEERKPRPQLTEALRCPRCNSNNTKFCYYNNYSTTQPRYFCKACRRYWTHGGNLRNVPIGGGCRKNKRTSETISSSNTSSSSSTANAQLPLSIDTISSKMSINKQLMMVPNMTMPAPMTTGLFPNVLPTLMSTSESSNFDFTLDNQQVSLPFMPMSQSNRTSVPVLAAGGSGTMPSFLEMLRRGLLLDGSNNRMDMPLPSYGTMYWHELSGSTTGNARQVVVGTQQGVNIDAGAFVGSTGIQEEKEDEEEEGDNKTMMKSSKNNNGGSLLDRYWTKPDNNYNSNKGQQG